MSVRSERFDSGDWGLIGMFVVLPAVGMIATAAALIFRPPTPTFPHSLVVERQVGGRRIPMFHALVTDVSGDTAFVVLQPIHGATGEVRP